MASNGQITSNRMSPRLQDLFASSMRVAALVELSIDLSESEARQLGVLGNITTALNQLRERMKIRRAVPGSAPNESQAQIRLAVYELAAEATGGAEALKEIIKRGVETEAAGRVDRKRMAANAERADKILDESRASSAAQRQFIRAAGRLRIRQLNQLRTSIFDNKSLDAAIGALDELYTVYITAAMRN